MKNTNLNLWKRVPIGSVCHGIYDGLHATPEPASEGAIFLGIKNITEDGRLDLSEIRYIAEKDFETWTKRAQPLPGDIVFVYEATLNHYAIIPNNFRGCLGRRLAVIKPDLEKVDNRFLYYYFFGEDWRRTIAKNILSGSTVDRIPISSFPTFEISLPSLSTQHKIADILSAYDNLIVNNIKRIKILEEMAQLVYHEWFVNFRFPGHQQVPMVESELGLIPQGWEVKSLDEIVLEIIDHRGKTPKKLGGEWSESGIMAISALNVKQGQLISLEKAKYISEELYKKWMKSELQKGDILMTSEAPLGELYYLTENKKFCLSQRLFSIRANPKFIQPSILYLTLNSPLGKSQIIARQSGTTVSGIRQSELRKVPVIVSSEDLQIKAADQLDTFLQQVRVLQAKNINLRKTCDLLLPKLISGEIDVESLDSAIATDIGELAA